MTSEHLKRAREEYQIPFSDLDADAPLGMWPFFGSAVGSRTHWNEDNTRAATQSPVEVTRSPALKRSRGESIPLRRETAPEVLLCERWVRTRRVPVEVIRGDSGRHFTFTFVTTVHWRWVDRSTIYRAHPQDTLGSSQDDAGCDLEEVVCAYTIPSCDAAPICEPVSVNEESSDGAAPLDGVPVNEVSPTYYYSKTSTSRVVRPPSQPASDYAAPRTASLLVDCLLQCAAEETTILETSGWAWLFRGKSLRSEGGRTLLEAHLLSACVPDCRTRCAESTPVEPPTPLQICVFRTY